MSGITEEETIYEYYLRKKDELSDWKFKLRNNLCKLIDNDNNNNFTYATLREGVHYNNNNQSNYKDKRKYQIIDQHILDVVKYIEEQGLEWYLDIKCTNYANSSYYDEFGFLVIHW